MQGRARGGANSCPSLDTFPGVPIYDYFQDILDRSRPRTREKTKSLVPTPRRYALAEALGVVYPITGRKRGAYIRLVQLRLLLQANPYIG